MGEGQRCESKLYRAAAKTVVGWGPCARIEGAYAVNTTKHGVICTVGGMAVSPRGLVGMHHLIGGKETGFNTKY